MNFFPTIYHQLDYEDMPNSLNTSHPLLALALLQKGKNVNCNVTADYLDVLQVTDTNEMGSPVDSSVIARKLKDFLSTKISNETVLPKDIYLEQAFPNHSFAPILPYNAMLKHCYTLYKKGIFIGLQSISAYVYAQEKNLDCLIIDTCYLYYSTLLNKNYLLENGIIIPKLGFTGAIVEDLQLPHAIIANKVMTVNDTLKLMEECDFTYMPVTENKKLVGWVCRDSLLKVDPNLLIGEIYTKRPKRQFIKITPETSLHELENFLKTYPVAFITDINGKFVLGVACQSDLNRYSGNSSK
eukprot:NODE_377_length_8484_cov_0.957782.p4 type:complete len:298 gc:universal NODE_377_length_8484_cov_0.957782:4172-3279(-)